MDLIQKDHISRLTTVVKHIMIALPDGMAEHFVSNASAVDEKILLVCLASGVTGSRNPPR